MDSDYYYYYDNDLNIINYTIMNGEKYEKRIIWNFKRKRIR